MPKHINRSIGNFGILPQGTDVTGRMIRDHEESELQKIPVPKAKPHILSNADDQDVMNFIGEFERRKTHLHKDNKGYLTVGIGHRVINTDAAKDLPFQLMDEEGSSVRTAMDHEVEELVRQVNAIPHGQDVTADQYAPKNNKNMQNIHLSEEDINGIFSRDLRVRGQELRRNWKDFDNYPAELQQGMLDLHFNVGGVTPTAWKGLNKAILEKNKETVAHEIHRITKHEDRNKEVQSLIRKIKDHGWF